MRIRFALFAFLMTFASVASAASRTHDVTLALTQEYAVYVKAFANKNMAPIERQVLPEWTGNIKGQRLNRSQLLSLTEDAMNSTRAVKDMCIKIKHVTVKGNVAYATVTDTASLVVDGPNGQPRTLTSSDLRKDTWVRTASGWKLKRSEMIKSLT
jgi:hypothetical protein